MQMSGSGNIKDVDLDSIDNIEFFGTSGSGHQIKSWIDIDNSKYLLKINSKYREASKEESVSKILDAFNIPHCHYDKINVIYKSQSRVACICKSFLNDGESSVQAYRFVDNSKLYRNISANQLYNILIDGIDSGTNIERSIIENSIKAYMVIDFIVMNPDRHLSNIELIYNEYTNTWRLAPLFDFGQSFLGRDSMLSSNEYKALSRKFKAKPFSSDQKKNLIDIEFAKDFCDRLSKVIYKVDNLDIPDFHKFVVKDRINTILNMR